MQNTSATLDANGTFVTLDVPTHAELVSLVNKYGIPTTWQSSKDIPLKMELWQYEGLRQWLRSHGDQDLPALARNEIVIVEPTLSLPDDGSVTEFPIESQPPTPRTRHKAN